MEKSFPSFQHPIPPILPKDARFLILGSFPSQVSFTRGFYYAHYSNQFWKILCIAYPDNPTDLSTATQEEKIAFLHQHRIALWDVYHSVRRKIDNSSDGDLFSQELNDFTTLLQDHPTIYRIGINSKTAFKDFTRKFWEKINFSHHPIELISLPSPSARYAKMNISEKAAIYKDFFENT